MNELHRQTGRTTRMLEEAARLSRAHCIVYVLMTNGRDVKRVEALLRSMFDKERGRHMIKVEAFDEGWEAAIDWATLKARSETIEVLMDHTVLEQRIQVLQTRMAKLAKQVAIIYPHTV